MEDRVIKDFRSGKKKAFQLIFDSLYQSMYFYANKFVYDTAEAEDIIQEAFIALWKQKKKFLSIDQVKAYLYLTIKNKCLNTRKHETVKKKYTDACITSSTTRLNQSIVESEVINNLYQAINVLPEQQKKVIKLHLKGLKNDEIARELSISVNSIKLYKKKAYQKIRDFISL